MMRDRSELAAWHANKPGEKMPGAGAGNNICICKMLM